MPLKLYNSMSRKVEIFKPLKGKSVRMYSCGPTLYNQPHIGNNRSFVFSDILKRWLEFNKFKVKHIVNITDIDDKTIAAAQKEKIPLKKFTRKYEEIFLNDIKLLNIKPASKYARATEHIKDMIALIKVLMKKKLAYKAEDGIYFSISKFAQYGKLSGVFVSEDQNEVSQSRISSDEYDKEEVHDFALWKFRKPADGSVSFKSPWGKGRPGWHIECSAMSMKYLGKTFDIHAGGIDLKFPHHENEIAQSSGATGKQFVRYWVHCEHLMVDGKKMSKSLGNIITLKDITDKNISPLALRYLFLTSHYRSQMNFTWESLQYATETLDKINDLYDKLQWLIQLKIKDKKHMNFKKEETELADHLNNDLQTVESIALVHKIISEFNRELDAGFVGSASAKSMLGFLDMINTVFAFIEIKPQKISAKDKSLIKKREKMRALKKYKEADAIRDQLKQKGIDLEDTPYGPRWRMVIK